MATSDALTPKPVLNTGMTSTVPGASNAAPGNTTSPIAMPVTTPNVPGATGVGNTAAPFGGAPTTLPTNPVQGTGISSGLSTVGGDYTTLGDFQQTYGKGTGTALETTLAGLGTATSGAVTATNLGIEQSAQRQLANMQAQQAQAGISPDSSSAALLQGDFASQVNQQIASTDAQMQLKEENTLLSALETEGTKHGTDIGTFGTIMDNLDTIGSGIGGVATLLSQATPLGAAGTATGGVLDVLSNL